MITDGKPFDTNSIFSGGAGMFIEYHDIVKPVYFYTIIKMILTNSSFGLPLDIIKNFSAFSLLEWYIKRRYKNPLQCLDHGHILDPQELDALLLNILRSDESIYKISPTLNIQQMMNVYREHHMSFPIYIYSEQEEPYIEQDCKRIFNGIPIQYIYGDLKKAVEKCNQNFTYILSDIELVHELAILLSGTCSHILLSRDYRYNYMDNYKTFKYNLTHLTERHPYIRIGTILSINIHQMTNNLKKIIIDREVDT